MLVLSRKVQEKVYIPSLGIIVTIASEREGKVRLGFEAPKGVLIFRQELLSPEQQAETERMSKE